MARFTILFLMVFTIVHFVTSARVIRDAAPPESLPPKNFMNQIKGILSDSALKQISTQIDKVGSQLQSTVDQLNKVLAVDKPGSSR